MGKRSTIVIVAILALLLAGIVIAVTRLYQGAPVQEETRSAPAGWSILKAIPSDAAAVLVFDGSAKAADILADSTGFLRGIVGAEQQGLLDLLPALGCRRLAISLHNSGSLVPLMAAELPEPDSLLLDQAARAGLKTLCKSGFFLASRSETFLNASARHLEGDISILGTRHLEELVRSVSGPAVLFVSHSHAGKLLQVYAGTPYRPYASEVKDLSAWSAWMVQDFSADHLTLKACALPGEAAGSFFAAFQGTPAQDALFPEVLPYFTSSALSLPLSDPDAFLASCRRFEDGNGRLVQYNKALKASAGRPLNPEEWLRSLQPREVVHARFCTEDGVQREAILLRSAKDLKLGRESANAYSGCLGTLLGRHFTVTDTVCASINAHWSVFGDLPSVRAFTDKSFLDYSLKDRLSDASVSLGQGFVAYASLSDAPQTGTDLLAPALAEPLMDFVRGAGYAPASFSMDLSGQQPALRLRLDKRALKGSKVQVMERDTVVVVPTGLFPVQNYISGQTNYLYQNAHLSICLNDENGKGVWGIPFKEKLCGRVQSIDYYNNKKIQFLFCAGSKLYLLDRLGHWVNGFPVSLGKEVLLGPDAYDFTGAGGYTITVLHKDNTLERYNLHGQKPEGWKGIQAPETVKNLPELLESKGKRYWVVRTSVRTLVYPFNGGEPLFQADGGKMLKPDARLTPTSKGVSGECYDGKVRDFKLN